MCVLESCQGNIGNCNFCSMQSECILMVILKKLERLETVMNQDELHLEMNGQAQKS